MPALEPAPSAEWESRGGRTESFVVETPEEIRLDVALARHFEDVSRAQAKRWIEEGRVRLEGRAARPATSCRAGERVTVLVPPLAAATPAPEDVPLAIVYEDAHLVVVDKPAGMVVHPAPGHSRGTLVNALLARTHDLSGIGGVLRPGIVHRLDAGTSGLIVVAKHDRAHRGLAAQFQRREVEKIYLAIVYGTPAESFVVDRPIGRDPRRRTRISSRTRSPRTATSEATTIERLPASSLLEIRIRTGRTHQIRVHMSESGHPLVGDRDYGAPGPKGRLPSHKSAAHRLLRGFERPALHASVLGLTHPESGKRLRWQAPLPRDMKDLLTELRRLREEG